MFRIAKGILIWFPDDCPDPSSNDYLPLGAWGSGYHTHSSGSQMVHLNPHKFCIGNSLTLFQVMLKHWLLPLKANSIEKFTSLILLIFLCSFPETGWFLLCLYLPFPDSGCTRKHSVQFISMFEPLTRPILFTSDVVTFTKMKSLVLLIVCTV